MRFWDTSAVVALLLHQPVSDLVAEAFIEDPASVFWWATAVEIESALQRLLRESVLTADQVERARDSFSILQEGAVLIEPGDEVRSRAQRLLGRHPLRSADALQLAAALIWVDGQARQDGFVCLDRRLSAAAEREGFTVFPEREDA